MDATLDGNNGITDLGLLDRWKLLKEDSAQATAFSSKIRNAYTVPSQNGSNTLLGEIPHWISRVEDYFYILRFEVTTMRRLMSQNSVNPPQIEVYFETITKMKTIAEENLSTLHQLIRSKLEEKQKPECDEGVDPTTATAVEDQRKEIKRLEGLIQPITNDLDQNANPLHLIEKLREQRQRLEKERESCRKKFNTLQTQITWNMKIMEMYLNHIGQTDNSEQKEKLEVEATKLGNDTGQMQKDANFLLCFEKEVIKKLNSLSIEFGEIRKKEPLMTAARNKLEERKTLLERVLQDRKEQLVELEALQTPLFTAEDSDDSAFDMARAAADLTI